MKYLPWVLLAALVVAVAWFVLRRKPAGSMTAPNVVPLTTGGRSGGNIFGKTTGALDTFNNVNAAGCALAARTQVKGIPSGLAQSGCSAFIKYATPIGWATTGVKAVSHPVDTAKSIGGAVAGGAKSVGHAIASIF